MQRAMSWGEATSSWGKMGATSWMQRVWERDTTVSVVGHPRAQRLSVDTPSGEGCNELAVPVVSVPTIYVNHVFEDGPTSRVSVQCFSLVDGRVVFQDSPECDVLLVGHGGHKIRPGGCILFGRGVAGVVVVPAPATES